MRRQVQCIQRHLAYVLGCRQFNRKNKKNRCGSDVALARVTHANKWNSNTIETTASMHRARENEIRNYCIARSIWFQKQTDFFLLLLLFAHLRKRAGEMIIAALLVCWYVEWNHEKRYWNKRREPLNDCDDWWLMMINECLFFNSWILYVKYLRSWPNMCSSSALWLSAVDSHRHLVPAIILLSSTVCYKANERHAVYSL